MPILKESKRLAAVLGAEIVSTFDRPDKVKLGTCKLVEGNHYWRRLKLYALADVKRMKRAPLYYAVDHNKY